MSTSTVGLAMGAAHAAVSYFAWQPDLSLLSVRTILARLGTESVGA